MKLPVWILKQEKLNNLTNCEMNMYLWLLERQNDMGLVRGVRVSDFKDIMSKQSFYNAIDGLKDKELINFLHHKNFNDYDVNLMLQNEESHKESEKFDEKYINLNKKIFQCSEFKKMSSREKAMMLLLYYRTSVKINANGSRAVYKKNMEDFYEYFTKLFDRSKRRVREYLHTLKEFFNISISGANYYIGRNRKTYGLDSKDCLNGKIKHRAYFVKTIAKRYGLRGVTDKFVNDVAGIYKNYIKSYEEFRIDTALEKAIKMHSKDDNQTASAARVHQLLSEGYIF